MPSLLSDGTSSYLSADTTLLAETSASSAAYPLTDALGSVRSLTDSSGSITTSASYGVYGDLRSASGSVGALGYTGALSDSSGLAYLQARELDPSSGTMLSRDSLTPGGPGVTGFNPYAYAGQNPTTYMDPSGQAGAAAIPASRGCGEYCQILLLVAATAAAVGTVGVGLKTLDEEVAAAIAEAERLVRSAPKSGPSPLPTPRTRIEPLQPELPTPTPNGGRSYVADTGLFLDYPPSRQDRDAFMSDQENRFTVPAAIEAQVLKNDRGGSQRQRLNKPNVDVVPNPSLDPAFMSQVKSSNFDEADQYLLETAKVRSLPVITYNGSLVDQVLSQPDRRSRWGGVRIIVVPPFPRRGSS